MQELILQQDCRGRDSCVQHHQHRQGPEGKVLTLQQRPGECPNSHPPTRCTAQTLWHQDLKTLLVEHRGG